MPNPIDDAALTQFIDVTFDFLCTRKLSELVEGDRVLEVIDATHTEKTIAYLHQRVGVPLRERLIARAKKSQLKVGDWFPDSAKMAISAYLDQPAPIPQKLIDEAVASEGVRDQIRESLLDSISGFMSKSTSGGGAMGALGLGARAFGAAGKAMLGGLGDGLQKQLQEKVREFVDGAVAGVQDRIAKRLADPKTAEALGHRRKKAFLKFLETPEPVAAEHVEKAPHIAVDALLPSIVRHNVQRAAVRDAIREEVKIVVDELSKESIGEILDHAGARDVARKYLHAHALPLARELVKTPAFGTWWNAR